MTPEELQIQAIAIVGVKNAHRWQTVLAKTLGVNVTTVNRWATGRKRITRPTEIAIASLVEKARVPANG